MIAAPSRYAGAFVTRLAFAWLIAFASAPLHAQEDPGADMKFVPTTFEVITLPETGASIVVGLAELGARIELLLGDAVVGRAEANELGEWIVAPSEALGPGSHALRLRTTTEDGRYQQISDREVHVVLPSAAAGPDGLDGLADALRLEVVVDLDAGAPVSVDATIMQPRLATIQRGDTLWELAVAFYGDGTLYPLILHANPEKTRNVRALQPGVILFIPETPVN